MFRRQYDTMPTKQARQSGVGWLVFVWCERLMLQLRYTITGGGNQELKSRVCVFTSAFGACLKCMCTVICIPMQGWIINQVKQAAAPSCFFWFVLIYWPFFGLILVLWWLLTQTHSLKKPHCVKNRFHTVFGIKLFPTHLFFNFFFSGGSHSMGIQRPFKKRLPWPHYQNYKGRELGNLSTAKTESIVLLLKISRSLLFGTLE